MYGSRLLVWAATAALSITAAAQTFITAPISSAAVPTTLVSSATTPTASSQPSGPTVILIKVGEGGRHMFEPDTVTARVGDIVRFLFYPGGHSVARAPYKYPCVSYELGGEPGNGWFTGEGLSPDINQNPPPYWDLAINDTLPNFFYCAAKSSCSKNKMIGVINPNSTQTFDVQKAEVQKATFDLKPGEGWPVEEGKPSTSTSTPSSTSAPSTESGGKSGLSAGAIAGIAVGAAAVVAIVAALIFFCGRRGGFKKAYRKSMVQPSAPGPDAAAAPPTMVEAQYHNQHNPASPVPTPAGLKSPGQTSFATFSTHPHMDRNDPYRSMTASPQHPPYPYGTPPPPHQNPASPGSVYGFNTYNGHTVSTPGSPPIPGPNSPLMIGELSSVPHARGTDSAPVELPSGDGSSVRPPSMMPGSPPPQYESGNNGNGGAKADWTAGEENQFPKR
ncbi:hypothetical protein QBC45DRAFT_404230 [Copromyces sp. CBS 386.78]|nr:hypothetical protein QBC45DRAFT_404230 [Copromyces sp. CBS 386.78]